ncbi:unnamed protein product [Oikopleura dioica]|uniref:Uncharacterized protein n=1 Tax=Oikopleura dioica TaxID=34765 RepID=E4YLP9_OIKDI|nr:unnamed protein product [Oikopleura dioica]
MTVLEDEERPDKVIYMNVWETIRVDLEMHRRGAKQAQFKYIYDEKLVNLRNDVDDINGDLDEDANIGLYLLGKVPGKITVQVFAHHPTLCKDDEWIEVSKLSVFIKKDLLNELLHQMGLLPCDDFDEVSISEIAQMAFDLSATIASEEVLKWNKFFKKMDAKYSRTSLFTSIINEIGIDFKIIRGLTKYTVNYGQQQSQESSWALVKIDDGSWVFYDPEIAHTLQAKSTVADFRNLMINTEVHILQYTHFSGDKHWTKYISSKGGENLQEEVFSRQLALSAHTFSHAVVPKSHPERKGFSPPSVLEIKIEVHEGEKIFVEFLNPKNLKICPSLNSPRGAGGNNSKPALSVQGNSVRLDFFTSTTCDLKISAGPKNDELFRYKITARFKRRNSQIHAVELLQAQKAEKIIEEKEKMIDEVVVENPSEATKQKTAEKTEKVEELKEEEKIKEAEKELKKVDSPDKKTTVKDKKTEIEPENVKIDAKSFSFAPNSTKDDILKTIFDYFMHHSLSEICEKIASRLFEHDIQCKVVRGVCKYHEKYFPGYDFTNDLKNGGNSSWNIAVVDESDHLIDIVTSRRIKSSLRTKPFFKSVPWLFYESHFPKKRSDSLLQEEDQYSIDVWAAKPSRSPLFREIDLHEKGRSVTASFSLAVDHQKCMRFTFPHEMYEQVQFKCKLSEFHLTDDGYPQITDCPIDKARTLIFSSDAGTTGEVTVKVECHKRGKYLLEVMGFHPDLCHGTDFKPLTSFLISVK